MTEAEVKARAERYNRVERVTDAIGRCIGVRRLKPSQQLRVQEFAPGLDGTTEVKDQDPASDTFGQTFEISKMMTLNFAAAVCEIDSVPYPFPKNRAELDAVLDRLDVEGIAAAAAAWAALHKPEAGDDASPEAVAKND